jgi:hypothetical protein
MVEEQTGKTPGGLQERPTLTPNQWYYREVFEELSGSRQYTMDGMPLPIPMSELLAYCELFGIEGIETRYRLYRMIRAQDAGMRKVLQERAEQEAKKR